MVRITPKFLAIGQLVKFLNDVHEYTITGVDMGKKKIFAKQNSSLKVVNKPMKAIIKINRKDIRMDLS